MKQAEILCLRGNDTCTVLHGRWWHTGGISSPLVVPRLSHGAALLARFGVQPVSVEKGKLTRPTAFSKWAWISSSRIPTFHLNHFQVQKYPSLMSPTAQGTQCNTEHVPILHCAQTKTPPSTLQSKTTHPRSRGPLLQMEFRDSSSRMESFRCLPSGLCSNKDIKWSIVDLTKTYSLLWERPFHWIREGPISKPTQVGTVFTSVFQTLESKPSGGSKETFNKSS